jgi:hypothetical protein
MSHKLCSCGSVDRHKGPQSLGLWILSRVRNYKEKTPGPESVSELYRPSDRRLSAKLVLTFADRRVPRGRRDGSQIDKKNHNFSETGSVSVFRRREGDTFSVGPLKKD